MANVSHELRTPLNMIIGFSEMITQSPQVYGTRLPPALLADITAIQRNSQHLAKLVDDVLDLSQVEAGRMALSKEWASLQDIVSEAAQVVQALFESKGLYLETEVSPGPAPAVLRRHAHPPGGDQPAEQRGPFHRARWACGSGPGRSKMASWSVSPIPALASLRRIRPGCFEPFQQLDGSIRRRHAGKWPGLEHQPEVRGDARGQDAAGKPGGGRHHHHLQPAAGDAPAVARAGGDAARWFSPYLQYEARTRRSKAPCSGGAPPLRAPGTRGDVAPPVQPLPAEALKLSPSANIEAPSAS